jgi:predicted lipase
MLTSGTADSRLIGFMTVQALTASKILAAVKTGVKKYGTNKVITTGHSLGAAIASLDAVYLKLADPSLQVSYVGFGQPRVGNDGFARFHKSIVPNSKHVTNKADPVPRLPGTFLGFSQLDGEVWIVSEVCSIALHVGLPLTFLGEIL